MFDGAFSPFHWLVVLAIALLVFGPKRVPEIGKSLGEAIRGFREGIKGDEHAPATTTAPPAAPRDAADSHNAH